MRHKPPTPEFSKEISVPVWNGHDFLDKIRMGGTQKLDGFFASFPQIGRSKAA